MQTEDPLYTRDELIRRHRISSRTLSRWIKERRVPPPDIAPTRQGQQWRHSTLRAAGLV